MATANTVNGCVERARTELTPAQMAVGSFFIIALGSTLLLVQDSLVHDSLHNLRHAVGIAYH